MYQVECAHSHSDPSGRIRFHLNSLLLTRLQPTTELSERCVQVCVCVCVCMCVCVCVQVCIKYVGHIIKTGLRMCGCYDIIVVTMMSPIHTPCTGHMTHGNT